jgi:hypothetical protein
MDRRRFLALLSASAATLCTHGVVAGAARAAQGSFPKAPYIFFSSAEGEFIEAAVARLIPADALGSSIDNSQESTGRAPASTPTARSGHPPLSRDTSSH